MAKAAYDFITNEWWVLSDVLMYVMGEGRLTPPEAENLCLDYANIGWFDDYQWHDSEGMLALHSQWGEESPRPVGGITPRRWGKRSYRSGTDVIVEWPHSRVVHRFTEPAPSTTVRDVREMLVPYGAPPDGYMMHLVRWRGVDVISMMRHAGFLSREDEVTLLRAIGYLPDAPPVKVVPASESAAEPPLVLPTEFEEAELPLRQRIACAIIRRHHPHDIPQNVADLERLVEKYWKRECKRQKVKEALWNAPLRRDAIRRLLRPRAYN